MLTENKTPSATKKKKQYSPIVFVNNPVKDTEHDVIGFDAQVKTLHDAIDNGATMIGVIADYGTGKSSMTELLCNRFRRRLHPRPIKVNMWDSLTQENITGDISGVSNLTRSFLFQLANGKNAAFSSYINKLLSKNYGNISFASSNPWRFGMFAIISGLLFGLHMMSTVSGTGVIQYLPEHMNKTISFIKALSPWFLVAAIASLLLGLKNLSIVFSHWKMPTRREVEVNDVFDTYRVIAKKITPWCKRKKRLVFIDDLDRVNDKRIIIAFLKELYRFQDSITKNRKQIVFIVSVKPESELKDNSEHPNPPTSNKKASEGDVKKTDQVASENQNHKETSLIYPKVFDTTLFLKPIHFDDYDSILLRLIKSAPKKKKALERLIEKDIKKALPYSFRWIKNGTNLTLRDLKDRLNHAVAIMVSLKNKSYENTSAANFEACAAVAYLESQYPTEYYRLIKNEESFAKFIQASYTIVNDATIEEDTSELRKKFASCFDKEEYTEEFIKALCGMVMEKIFKDDFRMYFYTYPKDSHIKTTEEREICNCLLFPKQYSIPTDLDEYVRMAYITGENETIAKTLMPLEVFPPIVIENGTLLNQAVEVSIDKAFTAFSKRVIDVKNPQKDLSGYWTKIAGIRGENYQDFINRCINKVAAIEDPESIVQKRLDIIKGFGKNVLLFKDLFDGIEGMPQITKAEIDSIGDPDIYIPLISLVAIEEDQHKYLCTAINFSQTVFHEGVWDKAVNVMKALMKIITAKEIGHDILRFLKNNRYLDEEMFSVVCSANISHEEIAEYINKFEPAELSLGYLKLLDQLGFSAFLNENIVIYMMKHAMFFTPILFYANNNNLHQMDEFLQYGIKAEEACKKINETNPEIVVAFRKHCLKVKAMRLFGLFYEEYPLITIEEYKMFHHASNAIYHINTKAIDEDNVSALLEVIYSRQYSAEDVVYLFDYLFKVEVNPNCISDESTVKSIIDDIEFAHFHTEQLTYEQRSHLYASFSDKYNISDSESAISFTRHFGCFIPEVEKIISADKATNTKYRALIVELDELSDVALLWVKSYYFTAPASEKLCNILFENGMCADYIVATMLREKRMIIDHRIDFSIYIEVYVNVSAVFDIMSDHWDFLERLQSEADLNELSESQLIPVFKVPQTQRFFEYMLSDKTTLELKKKYLKEFYKFKEEKDSIAFQRLICTPTNIKLVDSIDLKESISQRLWETNRNHKGQFTKAWNKEWSKKLSQPQPV